MVELPPANLTTLTFVIHGAPEVMCFTVDTHEHLVQMPAPR